MKVVQIITRPQGLTVLGDDGSVWEREYDLDNRATWSRIQLPAHFSNETVGISREVDELP